ncbi:3-deoxy-D-manno-octulosonate 8-phosphate phosphatase (KDO 8-P phosphatase) [Mariniphaga anaerophila]|uniref:3-deoxy-D-manno-octulosonate 8-phosphate phosphatase (KDO 8-P phosphatase) n=1 Tax=Mariniphaga anaerophila TaxID=1484053 RepID=A0A1M5G1C3_9BACT|nr:HAD family hydrolase [Mariniphaga anaerophila]SHF97454.1 3-deoxy-D-manno-octulosonate 8-phosphate phosphatase (KDO 8-P phosphatase) [Mariniphaga anaerophila]
MSFFKEELKNVKAFVFDVDGVLSKDTSPLNEKGEPVRTANVKDGFAMRVAIAAGYPVAIITGGFVERVRLRHEHLGVKFYYENAHDKVESLEDFCRKTGVAPENVLFMGDDLVDYHVMLRVGIPVCPHDAVYDIKSVSKYISHKNGGEGCVRDVIEQTLRAQEKWLIDTATIKNAF